MGFRKEHLLETRRSARNVAEQAEAYELSSPYSVNVQYEVDRLRQVETGERNRVALRVFREAGRAFGMVHAPSLYCPRVSVSTKESE